MRRGVYRLIIMAKIVVIFTSLLFVICCDVKNKAGDHHIIYAVNNSDKDIFVVQNGCEPLKISYFPSCFRIELVQAHSSNTLTTPWYASWEDRISSYQGKAAFFILDADSVRAVSSDTTINFKPMNRKEEEELYELLDRRTQIVYYYYSISDLEEMNWTITYP